MLLDLVKFVVRTRFSKPFLILIAVVVTYQVGLSVAIPHEQASSILSYYGTAIVALFLAMALLTGGVMVLKSDRDYLFTLPLSARDLSISIFFSQFIAFGITILFMFVYLAQSLAAPLLLVDLFALALAITSLGILATSLGTKTRVALSATLAAWTLVAFAGFPLSPGSAFNGNAVGGTLTLLGIAAATTTLAFNRLSRVELDLMRNLVRSSSAEIKSPNSYAGKSPLGAIYSMNLSSMAIAGRMNMAGTSRYVSRRVRTRWVAAATSLSAAAYFLFVLLRAAPAPITPGTDSLPAAILVAVLLSLLGFFFSQSAIVNERLWLSLTSLPPATYFRHMVTSKLISFLVITVPFTVADAALAALGYGAALAALAVVALVIPAAYVVEMLWSAYVAPIQVKGEDISMQAQFSLKQFSTALPMIAVIVLAGAATVEPVVALAGGATLAVVAVALASSGAFWNAVVVRLTETGFV